MLVGRAAVRPAIPMCPSGFPLGQITYCLLPDPVPMATKLRILVPVKRVLDYAIKPRIKKDQSGIDLSIPPQVSELEIDCCRQLV